MAVGIRSGSATSRSRSSGVLARCQIDAPIALQVVSIPASNNSAIVPNTCRCEITSPSISAPNR